MASNAKCRGCGVDIIWIKTEAGKAHPVDAKPKKMFVEVVLSSGVGTTTDPRWMLVDCYVSHFSTCPKAADFRTKKESVK